MKPLIGFLSLVLLLIGSLPALAEDNNAPAIVSDTCYMCHSEHGNNPDLRFVPRLAAQDKVYIEEQLKAFRDGSRASPPGTMYMWPISQNLTPKQIEQVAQWFASQRPPTPFPRQDPQLYNLGKQIFEKGILKADVPACASCHGSEAKGNGIFPRLAGQTPQYLQAQLRYFRSGVRNDAKADVMKPIATHLSEEDMNAVAHYLSSL